MFTVIYYELLSFVCFNNHNHCHPLKPQAVQIERKTLSNQLVDAAAENRRLQAEIKAMYRSVK